MEEQGKENEGIVERITDAVRGIFGGGDGSAETADRDPTAAGGHVEATETDARAADVQGPTEDLPPPTDDVQVTVSGGAAGGAAQGSRADTADTPTGGATTGSPLPADENEATDEVKRVDDR